MIPTKTIYIMHGRYQVQIDKKFQEEKISKLTYDYIQYLFKMIKSGNENITDNDRSLLFSALLTKYFTNIVLPDNYLEMIPTINTLISTGSLARISRQFPEEEIANVLTHIQDGINQVQNYYYNEQKRLQEQTRLIHVLDGEYEVRVDKFIGSDKLNGLLIDYYTFLKRKKAKGVKPSIEECRSLVNSLAIKWFTNIKTPSGFSKLLSMAKRMSKIGILDEIIKELNPDQFKIVLDNTIRNYELEDTQILLNYALSQRKKKAG